MAKGTKKPASVIDTIKQANENDGKPFIIRIGVGRPPRAMCSCGWDTPPNENLIELGTAAFGHRDDTGHQLRRPDDAPDYM
ncbi:gp093 [Rhodococcus phage ReqiPepy6]|uniref:Gp093 n=1 Tax=Rhodococcus phage ReqiPepy6 TaxID=691965 RepID=D4P7K4_9CAUD|nr:gp093 [Rhodococcus phage ReqiPepy6]ADD80984.1 gp093 [Rhodococcus phage ReqiPepy6]